METMQVSKRSKKSALQMVYEEDSSFDTFVRPQGHKQHALVRNTDGNRNFVCLQELHRAPLTLLDE